MKKLLAFGLTFLLSVNTFSSTLNLDYASILEEVRACRSSIHGCTAQEELKIAQLDGKILSPQILDTYLPAGKQKSYFIPLSLDNKELLLLAAATSLGVIAFHNDQEIMDTVQKHKTNVTPPIASVGNFLGGNAVFPIVAGSYFLGVYYQDNKLKKVALITIGSSIAQGLVTAAVKASTGRARPNTGDGPKSFFGDGDKSFYSGHTAEAFTIATVISEMYKEDHPIVPWVAYGLASVAAYARVHDEAHWASDVVLGAIAGHLITKLAISAMNKNEEGRSGLTIFPSFDPDNGAFMIYAEWTEKEKDTPFKCSKMPEGMMKVDACIAEVFARAKKR